MSTIPKISISEITNKTPQEIADSTCLPVIFCDHQATRRQRIHGAALPSAPPGYSSTHILEVLEHLAEQGYDTAVFLAETPDGRMQGAMARFEALGPQNPEIDAKSLK